MDSLRAVAAILVVLYHLRGPAHLPAITRRGDAGLSVFFFISAFLLYRPFVRAHMLERSAPALAAFARRRILRIVPAYWVALTVFAILLSYREVFGSDGLLYYGFGQIYRPGTALGGLGPAWTLCIEAALYAFLPLWAWAMRRIPATGEREVLRNELLGTAGLFALGTIYYLAGWYRLGSGLPFWISDGIVRFLDVFALGMALAALSVWWETRRTPAVLRPLNRFPGLSWLLAGLAVWGTILIEPLSARTWATSPISVHFLYTAIGLLIVLPCVVGDQRRGLLRRGLSWRPVVWVGMVSYGVYLWHRVVIDALGKWHIPTDVARALQVSPGVIYLLFVIVLTLIVAGISWHLIERPALRIAHRPWNEVQGAATGRVVSPLARALAAAVAAVLVVAGVSGVGYLITDIALVAAGGVLAALALQWRTTPGTLSAATPIVAVVAALAAAIPLLLKPNAASGTTTSTSQATGNSSSSNGVAAPPLTRAQRIAYLVLTFDGRTLRLYVDGRPAATRAEPGPTDQGANLTEIGGYRSAQHWSGSIDELALYSSALSPQAVAQHYRIGTTTGATYSSTIHQTPGLVGFWPLNDPRRVTDTAGRATAVGRPTGMLPWYGLIAGSRDRSIAFNGVNGVINLKDVPVLRNGFSVEMWVLPGSAVSNRTIVSRPGGMVPQDRLPRTLAGGFFRRGRPARLVEAPWHTALRRVRCKGRADALGF